MKRTMKLTCLVAVVIMAACVTIIPIPNADVAGSKTSGQLLKDARGKVVMFDAVTAPQCREPRHFNAEQISLDPPGTLVERWRVTRCNATESYRLTFVSNAQFGGTDIGIQREGAPAAAKSQ